MTRGHPAATDSASTCAGPPNGILCPAQRLGADKPGEDDHGGDRQPGGARPSCRPVPVCAALRRR